MAHQFLQVFLIFLLTLFVFSEWSWSQLFQVLEYAGDGKGCIRNIQLSIMHTLTKLGPLESHDLLKWSHLDVKEEGFNK